VRWWLGDGFADAGGERLDGVPAGWFDSGLDAGCCLGLGGCSGRRVALGRAVGGVGLPVEIWGWARARARGTVTLVQTCTTRRAWKGLGFNQTRSICFRFACRFASGLSAGHTAFPACLGPLGADVTHLFC